MGDGSGAQEGQSHQNHTAVITQSRVESKTRLQTTCLERRTFFRLLDQVSAVKIIAWFIICGGQMCSEDTLPCFRCRAVMGEKGGGADGGHPTLITIC